MTDSRISDVGAAGQQCPHLAVNTREFADSFHESLHVARAQSPVAWDDSNGCWFVTGADTLFEVSQNWATFSSAYGVTTHSASGGPKLLPIETDPPLHTQWRSILNRHFTKAALDRRAGEIRRIVSEFIDAMAPAGHADMVRDLAEPLPGRVLFQAMLRLTDADLGRCTHQVEMAIDYGHPEVQAAGYAGLFAVCAELVEARSAAVPDEDSITDCVVHARIDGEPVSRQDATSILAALVFGGLETTGSALGSSLLHLARDPALADRLRAHPDGMPTAVEEFLRLYTPAVVLCRQAQHDAELAGLSIAEGQRVGISFAAACRDPEVFEQPDLFRMDRPHYRHYAFGVGIHRCLGSNLARLVLRLSLEAVLDRLGDLRLAPGAEPTYRVGNTRGLERLDVTFSAHAVA
jgi:cytochrome P450